MITVPEGLNINRIQIRKQYIEPQRGDIAHSYRRCGKTYRKTIRIFAETRHL